MWYNKVISNNNICFRCGRERIISKTYKGLVNGSSVTFTDTICPDKDCQKAVNLQLKTEKVKRAEMAKQKILQAEERLAEKRKWTI